MNKVKKFLYSQKAAPYVFILPFVLTVILVWVFPIANGVLLSFQDVLKDISEKQSGTVLNTWWEHWYF